MSTLFLRGPRRPITALTVTMLVALALVGLLVANAQPIHSHAGAQTGLYDAQCPLAALAAVHVAGPLASPAPSGWIALAALVLLAPGDHAAQDSLGRPAQPRAPPTC
jgi:hypothetical protein